MLGVYVCNDIAIDWRVLLLFRKVLSFTQKSTFIYQEVYVVSECKISWFPPSYFQAIIADVREEMCMRDMLIIVVFLSDSEGESLQRWLSWKQITESMISWLGLQKMPLFCWLWCRHDFEIRIALKESTLKQERNMNNVLLKCIAVIYYRLEY